MLGGKRSWAPSQNLPEPSVFEGILAVVLHANRGFVVWSPGGLFVVVSRWFLGGLLVLLLGLLVVVLAFPPILVVVLVVVRVVVLVVLQVVAL